MDIRWASMIALLGAWACGDAPDNGAGTTGVNEDGGATIVGDASTSADAAAPPRADGGSSNDGEAASDASSDGAPAPSTTRVVAYLPNYSGSYATWATAIDFAKMTHLNLAFATANGNNAWDMGASDQEVSAIVSAAHAKGVRVLASLGGGGGDQTVIAQYKNAGNVPTLVANLRTFVAAHGLDGVDVDIEDPSALGSEYSAFVDAVVKAFRPQGKLVTAAVAQYLQGSMADATLHTFDFVNVMIYSSYDDSIGAMTYYAQTKAVPKELLTLGAGFFGTDSAGDEFAYKDILAADGTAWSKDQAQVNGKSVSYTGMASMKKLAEYSKGYGGIMVWDLSEDTTDAHSLYKVIQGAM